MPRKKIFENPPLEKFTVDGTIFEIRDETCWPIGRGQHSALEHYIKREKPIYEHINNIIFKNNDSNENRKNGIETVKGIFKSPTSFANAICEWGLFGENGTDTTDARKEWYPRYKIDFYAIIRAYEENQKVRLPPTPE